MRWCCRCCWDPFVQSASSNMFLFLLKVTWFLKFVVCCIRRLFWCRLREIKASFFSIDIEEHDEIVGVVVCPILLSVDTIPNTKLQGVVPQPTIIRNRDGKYKGISSTVSVCLPDRIHVLSSNIRLSRPAVQRETAKHVLLKGQVLDSNNSNCRHCLPGNADVSELYDRLLHLRLFIIVQDTIIAFKTTDEVRR